MKTIEINKGGFGIASLFDETLSTKDILVEDSNKFDGSYLDELGIEYKIGDTFTLKTPLHSNVVGYKYYFCKVYNVSDSLVECEFISKKEL